MVSIHSVKLLKIREEEYNSEGKDKRNIYLKSRFETVMNFCLTVNTRKRLFIKH